MEISYFPNKKYRVMVIKMLTDLGLEWKNIVRTSKKKNRKEPITAEL